MSERAKARDAKIRCYAVEPKKAAVLATGRIDDPRHLHQGTGYGIVPRHFDRSLADGSLAVSDSEASDHRRRLAVEEGLYVGYSAAANVAAAVRLISDGTFDDDATVVTVLCDTGVKY